jgi:hypothetical protein
MFGQATGDYRSNGTGGGKWSVAATWQTYNGSTWVAATNAPTGSQVVTIQSTDSVYFDVAVNITDTLKNQGKFSGASNLTIASGGIYQHDLNGGSLPVATWSVGSTCLITGVSTSVPSNGNQGFYNFIVNSPGWIANMNMGWGSTSSSPNTPLPQSIYGNVIVRCTGTTGRWNWCAPASGSSKTVRNSATVSVYGDLIVDGSATDSAQEISVTSNGTSNAYTDIIINSHGNVVVTGNPTNTAWTNFSVSRGSQGSGTGTTKWNLYGDFTMSDATTMNSNATNAKFVFAKSGTQNIVLNNVTFGSSGSAAVNIDVDSGSVLNLGMTALSGGTTSTNTGSFNVLSHATIVTAHPDGIDGNVTCTGESGGGNKLSKTASYAFNGTAAQVTGSLMPDTVSKLTINNASGVTLTQATTVMDTLFLLAGVFHPQGHLTLGPSAFTVNGGGSIEGVTPPPASRIPKEFYVSQNYPNPFNPTTEITYGLPKGDYVTARVYNLLGQELATLFTGRQSAGVHTLHFDGSNLCSGIYFYRIQAGTAVEVKRMILNK